MSAKAMINRALTRAATPSRVIAYPQGSPTPGLVRPQEPTWLAEFAELDLPTAPGATDQTMIAESRLRQGHRDGVELVESLRLMIMRAPKIAERVIAAANLGRESERQAAITLRQFARTKVAQVPETL